MCKKHVCLWAIEACVTVGGQRSYDIVFFYGLQKSQQYVGTWGKAIVEQPIHILHVKERKPEKLIHRHLGLVTQFPTNESVRRHTKQVTRLPLATQNPFRP